MLALRLVFTMIVMGVVVWLLRTGQPLGGLIIVPAIAVGLRRAAPVGTLA